MSDQVTVPGRIFAAVGCASAAMLVWVANLAETHAWRPSSCTGARMQYESWLLMSRVAAFALPIVGVLLARRAPRAALLNVAVLMLLVVFSWLLPLGHLPCLRS